MSAALVALVLGAVWVAALVVGRDRRPFAALAGLSALAWSATLVVPGAVLWHRGVLVHLLLSGGTWLPRSWAARIMVPVGYGAALAPSPWGRPWLATALSVAILLAAAVERRRYRPPWGAGLWRGATTLAAVSFAAPPLLAAAGLPRGWAVPVLLAYALVQVLVIALLVAVVRPVSLRGATDIAVDLGAAPGDRLLHALGTTGTDPRTVLEQAQVARAAAEELRRRLGARQERLAVILSDIEASRRRIERVDAEERAAIRRALDEVAVVRLERAARQLEELDSDPVFPSAGAAPADRADPAGAPTVRALHHLRLAIAEIDGLGAGLAPEALATGLDTALARLVATTPVAVSLDVPDDTSWDAVPPQVAACVYYVAAEALANVVKHAEASTVLVSLRLDEPVRGVVELVVSDDGTGLPGTPGAGLAGLRERAGEVGGRVEVAARPGRGTRVSLTVPVRDVVRT